MLIVIARLAWIGLLVLPVWAALALVVQRRGAARPLRASTAALAAAVLTPMTILLEVYALGLLPSALGIARPLDLLPWLHAGVLLLAVGFVVGRRGRLGLLIRTLASRSWRAMHASPVSRVLIAALLLWWAVVAYVAVWNVVWGIDALDYHIAQMLQPAADGRLGAVHAQYLWADTFPRAANLLKFWALQMGGGDGVVNGVSVALHGVMVLAAVVAARALGARRDAALIGGLTIGTLPIMGHLQMIGNVDIEAHTMVCAAGAMALTLKRVNCARDAVPLCLAIAGALAMALWMKFVTVGMVGAVGAAMLAMALARRKLRRATVLTGLVAALFGSLPYIAVWLQYPTPIYPIELKIGPVTIFEGPLLTGNLALRHDAFADRFGRTWTEWFAPLTADSPGSLGPLFTCVMLPGLLIAVFMSAASPRRAARSGLLLVALMFAEIVILPQQHVARFGLSIVFAGAIVVATVLSAPRRAEHRQAALLSVAVAAACGAGLWVQNVWRDDIGPAVAAGISLTSADRNTALRDALRPEPTHPSAATRARLRSLAKPGELVMSAVDGAPALLLDAGFTYPVRHTPALPWPVGFDPPADPQFGASGTTQWLSNLGRHRAAVVLVYKGWAEDTALAAESSGFALAFEQPPRDGPMVVRVYIRRAQ